MRVNGNEGGRKKKYVGALLYIDFWKQTLETESLQNWSQVTLNQPGFVKSFASSMSALPSLPSCAVTERFAIGVKAELTPEDIFCGK